MNFLIDLNFKKLDFSRGIEWLLTVCGQILHPCVKELQICLVTSPETGKELYSV